MSREEEVEIRPARARDAQAAAALLTRTPPLPGRAAPAQGPLWLDRRNQTVAARGEKVLGTCGFSTSPGRCALVAPPQMAEWRTDVAARLIRATASRAYAKGARLIQLVTSPAPESALVEAILASGMERLAVLAYMRRPVEPGERELPLPADIRWKRYSALCRGLFAEAITRTYEGSLDCPGLKGLRTVQETLATHRATGQFRPEAWHVALREGEPVGVELVNNLHGRGELVYLGVAAAARGSAMGRVLLDRAIRDTAEMGLPKMGLAVDVDNTPAVHLYDRAGFKEVRRRLVWYVPRERFEEFSERA